MEQLRGDTWLSGQYYAGNASSCVSKAKRCKMLFRNKQPLVARASKRQCPGEALLLVVKVVLVVFLTQPNDIEDIEWTKQTWL